MFAWQVAQEGLGTPSGWGYSSCRAWQFWQASPLWAWDLILSATSLWQDTHASLLTAGLSVAAGRPPWAAGPVCVNKPVVSNTRRIRNRIMATQEDTFVQQLAQGSPRYLSELSGTFTRPPM